MQKVNILFNFRTLLTDWGFDGEAIPVEKILKSDTSVPTLFEIANVGQYRIFTGNRRARSFGRVSLWWFPETDVSFVPIAPGDGRLWLAWADEMFSRYRIFFPHLMPMEWRRTDDNRAQRRAGFYHLRYHGGYQSYQDG